MHCIRTLVFSAGAILLCGCGNDEPGGETLESSSETGTGDPAAFSTAWGDPDLQGMWPMTWLNGTPLQRPESFGERGLLNDDEYSERVARLSGLNSRYDDEIAGGQIGMGHWSEMGEPNRLASLIVEPANGRIPALTAEGERRSALMRSTWSDIPFDSLADFNALDRCITRGLPASMFTFMYNSGIEVRQSPGYVIIRLELVHETRIIPIDGRPPLDAAVTQWLGESRGRWEGDTLVIETTNFNAGSPMIIVGPGSKPIPTSSELRVVERLTRTGPESLDYEITVEDPIVLTGSWRAAYPWKLDADYRFYEYACHEDNRTIRDFISSSRAERGLL